jgi:phage tail sheath protein FI
VPEYLAPGVYVEETSFRAKSIEGVATSTTGFVGPTRRGPVGGTPEILTSFGDFERIYGGQDNLGLSTAINYMAHAAFAYFDNGGSRLYVSRVFLANSNTDTGLAASADFTNGGADATKQSKFVARFPGAAGNGQVEVIELDTPATALSMNSATEGTVLRSGGAALAAGAQIQGGAPPFSLANDGVLVLTVNGVDAAPAKFHGESAEVAGTALVDPITIDATNHTFKIAIDGATQTITIADGPINLVDLVNFLNPLIVGGYARAAKKALVVGSDTKGIASSVKVFANAGLGFAADTTVTGAATPANNVNNLAKVTADEINAALVAAGVKVIASLSATTGTLMLTTTATGSANTLAVKADPASVAGAVGLPVGAPAKGIDGSTPKYYVKHGNSWLDSGGVALNLGGIAPGGTPGSVPADFITISVIATDADGHAATYSGMGLDPLHRSYLGTVLAMQQKRRVDDLEVPFGVRIGSAITAFDLRTALFGAGPDRIIALTGGNDGAEPIAGTYTTALQQFEKLEDISIVAAPGHSAYADFQGIQGALISHAERRRSYRIAVLDSAPGQAVSEARTSRAAIDSTYAAFYYPWVVVSNPLWRPGQDQIPRELTLPPSGFLCGIYARSDNERGVWKPPANEVVRGALRFESDINFGQQEVLNPLGVNCLRYFPGRGYRVWGARTASSDPEWKYVNVRRYFIYLEASLDRGTQWAVFEPNGEALWANIKETVTSFLYNEFVSGALLGSTPQEAFFVKCDRSTMTQADLDNGRLICLVGVAALKPAEFVIFRIGQKTADAKS